MISALDLTRLFRISRLVELFLKTNLVLYFDKHRRFKIK